MATPAPLAVAFPGTTEQVVDLVRLAASAGRSVVPSGGRTGLSGGAMALRGELVIAMDRMNTIKAFDAINQSVVCQAGVVTAQLQAYARDRGLFYPVDFAASGSSQIGGNIATNAGGIRVIRYGMTRQWVSGVKLVTGGGDVLDLNRGLTKNNTGYDLRHLVVGSEGTLGIVVEATMQLTTSPPPSSVVCLALAKLDAVMEVSRAFKASSSLSAFEFFSEAAMKAVVASGETRPFDTIAPFYVLLELDADTESRVDAAFNCFERCVREAWVMDGVISQSGEQAARLWRLREGISEALAPLQPYKNDLSVTPSQVPVFLAEVEEVCRSHYPDFSLVWYGHIGDGNLHLNVLKPEQLTAAAFHERCNEANEKIYQIVQSLGGSVSAEHGVGLLKRGALARTSTPPELAILRHIKSAFDPSGIMNPGKIMPTIPDS